MLSALLANDVVCLAITPVFIDVCARRRLDPVPYLLALAAGGLLLTSRRTASRANLALVDWQLLLLFIGLFVVHRAVERAVHAFAAHLIVVELAARSNVRIGWKTHARVGAPVAIVTLAIGAAWLALVA